MKDILLKLTIILLGISSGAMLLIGIGIAPYWSALEPSHFMQLFADSSPYMGKLMVPLGIGTAVVTLALTFVAYQQDRRNIKWLFAAAAMAILSALSFPLYFKETNALIQSMTLAHEQVPEILVTWQFWHWARIVTSMLALIAALQYMSCSNIED